MKAVLMSIKPKWCEKIFNGEKTVEVRKTAPKLEPPFKVYVYQTKNKGGAKIINDCLDSVYGGGKVVGEFVCDKVRTYIPFGLRGFELFPEWLKEMCLSKEQLDKYGGLKTLYGLHITAPKLYDKPKELSEFRKPDFFRDCEKDCRKNCDMEYYRCPTRDSHKASTMAGYCRKKGENLTRPPQSYCYVEEIEE